MGERVLLRMGRWALHKLVPDGPWEPAFPGDVMSSWERHYHARGHQFLVYQGKRRDYHAEFCVHDNQVWDWEKPFEIVDIKKLHKKTREIGIVIFGRWLTVLIDIHKGTRP